MPKRDPNKTPRSKVRAALRRLSLRSRERNAALKREKYTCERCGRKQSKAKGRDPETTVDAVQAHHRAGIARWEQLIDLVYELLLTSPVTWEVLCKECHKECHKEDI